MAGRLLDAGTVAVLEGFGVHVDLHTEEPFRCTLDATRPDRWQVQGIVTMTLLWTPAVRRESVRPGHLAGLWVVAIVGATARDEVGVPPVGLSRLVDSALEHRGTLWTVT